MNKGTNRLNNLHNAVRGVLIDFAEKYPATMKKYDTAKLDSETIACPSDTGLGSLKAAPCIRTIAQNAMTRNASIEASRLVLAEAIWTRVMASMPHRT